MKKAEQGIANYSISRMESLLLDKIKREGLAVFTPREVMHLLLWKKRRVHNILRQLKEKRIIFSIKRNTYAAAETMNENLFQIAVESISPSYISFWTALGYYGFTEQQPMAIQLVTTKQYKEAILGEHKVIPTRFKTERFFGYKKLANFTIAEKEKCIIDSLAYPEKAGGFSEVVKSLKNALPQLNKKLFLAYLVRFNNTSLNARVGYLLEELGWMNVGLSLPNAYVRLSNEMPAAKIRNKRWRLIINEKIPKNE